MARRLLYLFLGMLSSACVIPSPFEPSPPEPLYRPALITDLCSPKFGSFKYDILNKTPVLRIVAEDENDHDTLYARLFVVPPPTVERPDYEEKDTGDIPLTQDQSIPKRWSGTLPAGVNLCDLIKSQLGASNDPMNVQVIVRISDEMFSDVAGMQNTTKGLTDENYWVVSCTSVAP